jgi:serine/threonine protein phosphatase 1
MRTVDRILAISDLHGENQKLLNLLEKVEYNPALDLLIIGGDMIDRGMETLDTLATCEELRKNGAVLLKGNHEVFLINAIDEMLKSDLWRLNIKMSEFLYSWVKNYGGALTFDEIENLSDEKLIEIRNFLKSLPLYFSIGNYIFTHAGANVRKPIEANTEDETVWMKESFPWCPAYKGKILIFGHTPTWLLYPYVADNSKNKEYRKRTKIWYDTVYKDKIGIDCGGVFGGRLAALELPSQREFYE